MALAGYGFGEIPVPSQYGNSGKYLTTDGSVLSWGSVSTLPDQTGHSGQYLQTNGSSADWAAVAQYWTRTGTELSTTTAGDDVHLDTGGYFYFYNTADETTNYERAFIKWDTNRLRLGTEKGGSGTLRQLQLSGSEGVTTPSIYVAPGVSLGCSNTTFISWGSTNTSIYSGTNTLFFTYGNNASSSAFQINNIYSDPTGTTDDGGIHFQTFPNNRSSIAWYASYFSSNLKMGRYGNMGLKGDLCITGKQYGLLVDGVSASLGAITITPFGGTGSTTWGYKYTVVTSSGESAPSAEVTIANGANTHTINVWNYVYIPVVENALTYKVYRTTYSGSSGYGTGLIFQGAATLTSGTTGTFVIIDCGIPGGAAPPTTNNTAVVRFGSRTNAPINYQFSQASGYFSANGDAQTTIFTSRAETTDGTANVELYVDGSAQRITVTASRTWGFKIMLSARQTAGAGGTVGDSSYWEIDGCIKRDGSNNTALVGSTTTTLVGQDAGAAAWAVAVTADDTNESLKIAVTGEATKTIHWVARVTTVEVG